MTMNKQQAQGAEAYGKFQALDSNSVTDDLATGYSTADKGTWAFIADAGSGTRVDESAKIIAM